MSFPFSQICMDIFTHIVKASKPPFEDFMLNTVFPVTVKTILSSDDNAVLQVGDMCLLQEKK